ncbi:MAG: hypothetical protein KTR31_38010 [Myxococcales bacterium]|nr:hypothetical protein [Myxococcales bacterium]
MTIAWFTFGLFSAAMAEEPCAVSSLRGHVGAAEQASIATDATASERFLQSHEAVLGDIACLSEAIGASDVARVHRVMAMHGYLTKDADATQQSFRAMQASDPSLDLQGDWPEQHRLREQLREARNTPDGERRTLQDLADAARVFVDGQPLPEPPSVPTDRPYVLQRLLPTGGTETAYVRSGEAPPARVLAPPPASDVSSSAASRGSRWLVQLMLGASASRGEALQLDGVGEEPANKMLGQFEVTAGLEGSVAWARAQLGAGSLLGGRYLFSREGGEPGSTALQLDGGVAGGLVAGPYRVGASVEALLPSRVGARAVLGWIPSDRIVIEMRPGVDLPTQRTPEPALELLIGFRGVAR